MPVVDEPAAAPPRRPGVDHTTAEPRAYRPLEAGHSLDVAGASGIATLRRQLATLQLQLSDVQGQLAREQEGRAADAEEMARVLALLSTSEAENDSLASDLERERVFVEELRVSVREKYEDCNVLRQRLADAESLLAKELEEAADRHALTERAERAEHRVSDLTERLEESRASQESARTEVATISAQLHELRSAHEEMEAELAKSNATLKNAHMKVFAANKQLESWKSESQRTMEQTRTEQDAALAKMTAEHSETAAALRRQADDAGALVVSLQKQMEVATEKLALASKSLEVLEEVERQVHGVREQARTARRLVFDHALQARKALSPASPGFAAPPPLASPPVAVVRQPASAEAAPPRTTLAQTTRPPVDSATGAAQSSSPASSDAPVVEMALEIGEIEMGADDLVLELIEARTTEKTKGRITKE
jgi:DNA repair exonuclease SbcCD ATPase subunit